MYVVPSRDEPSSPPASLVVIYHRDFHLPNPHLCRNVLRWDVDSPAMPLQIPVTVILGVTFALASGLGDCGSEKNRKRDL